MQGSSDPDDAMTYTLDHRTESGSLMAETELEEVEEVDDDEEQDL